MDITPIETHYAGCRFRSRLEARWAVFFDKLGITWEYEPQGYVVNGTPYLPDFRLPDMNAFVEVKGASEKLDLKVLTDLAEKPVEDEYFILILGQVPDAEKDTTPTHAMFSMVFDWRQNDRPAFEVTNRALTAIGSLDEPGKAAVKELMAYERRRTVICHRVMVVPGSGGVVLMPIGHPNTFESTAELLNPSPIHTIRSAPSVVAAYAAARSARFEHGESGA